MGSTVGICARRGHTYLRHPTRPLDAITTSEWTLVRTPPWDERGCNHSGRAGLSRRGCKECGAEERSAGAQAACQFVAFHFGQASPDSVEFPRVHRVLAAFHYHRAVLAEDFGCLLFTAANPFEVLLIVVEQLCLSLAVTAIGPCPPVVESRGDDVGQQIFPALRQASRQVDIPLSRATAAMASPPGVKWRGVHLRLRLPR